MGLMIGERIYLAGNPDLPFQKPHHRREDHRTLAPAA
jgi:hypothetical protein